MHSDSLRRPAKPTAQTGEMRLHDGAGLVQEARGTKGLYPYCFCDGPWNTVEKSGSLTFSRPGRLGEPPIGVYIAARHDPWLILLGKELPDQFSAAAHADFFEDRFEVVLHGMGCNVKGIRHLSR